MQAEAASAISLPESHVVSALKNAAAATGSDFHYLLGTAMRESSLKPDARSHSSSAAGLFQFIDQTWLADATGRLAQADAQLARAFDTLRAG